MGFIKLFVALSKLLTYQESCTIFLMDVSLIQHMLDMHACIYFT